MHKIKSGGFFYGWVIVGIAFLLGVTEAGAFQSILSIFMKPMAATFGWSRTAVSVAMVFGSIGGGLLSPFIGPSIDRHGTRMVAFSSVLVLSTGLVCLYFLSSIWQLYLFFGIGRMVAVGILTLVITVAISNWFVRLRGRAMGITWLGPRVGSAILPILVQFFILTWGWRFAWVGLGVLVFIISGLPAIFFLRRRPEDYGLLPDGDKSPPKNIPQALDSEKENTSDTEKKSDEKLVVTRRQVFRSRVFWLLTASTSIFPFVQGGTNFHYFPFMTDQGISSTIAILTISVFSVFGAAGALLWGYLADRFSSKSLLTFNGFTSAVVFFSFYMTIFWGVSASTGTALLFIFMSLMGFLHGGRNTLQALVWAEFYDRRILGSIYSLGGPFRWSANAIGPIFGALFFDLFGNYMFPFHIFAFLFLLGGFICLFLKSPDYQSTKL